MDSFLALALAEFIGTLILIALGNGIGQILSIRRFQAYKTSSWLTIFLGWGFAIIAAVTVSSYISAEYAASLNPAVAIFQVFKETPDLGFATAIGLFFIRTGVSLLGAICGQLIIDTLHLRELQELDGKVVLSTHSTVPADPKRCLRNFFNEFVATTIFVLAVAAISLYPQGTNVIVLGFVGSIVIAVFGPSTGASINPSRDLGPRIVFQLLPFGKKGEKDAMWSYSFVPTLAPLLGGMLAGVIDLLLNI